MDSPRAELKWLVDAVGILDEDAGPDWHLGALVRISWGIVDGRWSEAEQPDLFAELREVLRRSKAWYVSWPMMMEWLRSYRAKWPDGYWWWYPEAL